MLKSPLFRLSLGGLIAGLFMANSANAAFATYQTSASWNAATPLITGTEDFNGFAVDTSFQGVSVAINNGFVLGQTGTNGAQSNLIKRPPDGAGLPIDGTTLLVGDLKNAETIEFSFTQAIYAWSAEFRGLSNGIDRNTEIKAYDAANNLVGTITTDANLPSDFSFYGFVSDVAIQKLVFQNTTSSNDIFTMDNIKFSAVSPVPEPETLVLWLMGLMAVVQAGRKRRFA